MPLKTNIYNTSNVDSAFIRSTYYVVPFIPYVVLRIPI